VNWMAGRKRRRGRARSRVTGCCLQLDFSVYSVA
jgi:hypothetical protein